MIRERRYRNSWLHLAMTGLLFACLAAPALAQNPDEPLESLRVGLPEYLTIGVQEYFGGLTYLAVTTTYTGGPIVVRDGYDADDQPRSSVFVEHLEAGYDGTANVAYNVGGNIVSVRYAGSRVFAQEQGWGGFSRLGVGPGLFFNDQAAALALIASAGSGYGYHFRRFAIGIVLEGTAGVVFFDGQAGFYSGGGFGIYMTRRVALKRGRVRDVPEAM